MKDYASMRVSLMNLIKMSMKTRRVVQPEKMKKITASKKTPLKRQTMILIEIDIYFSCIAPFPQKVYLGGYKDYSALRSSSDPSHWTVEEQRLLPFSHCPRHMILIAVVEII